MKIPKMPYGQGSFVWQNDEHTRLRYALQYRAQADNKVYRLSVTGKNPRDCLAKMEIKKKQKEREARARFKTSLDNPTVVLSDAMTTWLFTEKALDKKARTIDRDEVTIKNQIDGYEIGRTPAFEIEADDIDRHIRYLQYEAKNGLKTGYSFSTVKKVYELLNQFFRYCYRKSPADNPMLKTSRPKQKSGTGEINPDNKTRYEIADVVLTDQEIKVFKEYALAKPTGRFYGQSKYGAALYFILQTFVRAGEALALKWQDIDIDNKRMTICKTISRVKDRDADSGKKTKLITTTPKTEVGTRTVVLTDEALEALQIIRERSRYTDPQDYVIATSKGNAVSENRLYIAVRNLLAVAGLMNEPREECFGVHYLRHTGISYYLRHNVPVSVISKMAGHSSELVTTSIYYHVVSDQKRDALELMNSINK